MSTSGIGNSNRVFGLSGSGIDVDAMVTKLMTAAKQPYTKMDQQQILLGWKKQAYNDVYTSINDFRSKKLFDFSLKSTLAAKTATSSNSSAVAVTASGDAANMNHTLQVLRLASGVTQASSAAITTGTDKLTLAGQFGVSGSVALTINGKNVQVNASQSINDLVSTINKSGAGVVASYDALQDRFFIQTSGTGDKMQIDYSGTDTNGLNFLTRNLKITPLSNVGNGGVSSSGNVGFSDTSSLSSQFSGLTGKFTLKMAVGGAETIIAVDTKTTSLNDIMKQINNLKDTSGNSLATASFSSDGKLTIAASNPANPIDLSGSDPAAISFLNTQLQMPGVAIATPLTSATSTNSIGYNMDDPLKSFFGNLPSTFTLNFGDGATTTPLTISSNTSMTNFVKAINDLKDSNGKSVAVAKFEHGKFTLQSATNGGTLDLTGSDSAAMVFLSQSLKLTSQKGQDAQVRLDGVMMNQANNKFTVNNVSYSAQGIGTSSVSIQSDTEKIVSSIKTFISDYNTMLDAINTKANEKYDKNYLPLTDEQKSAMKDADISLWTAKAKTGLLRRDPALTALSDGMRNLMASKVDGLTGDYTSAISIGITTSSDWTEKGKLYIDESKLRKALEKDPDVAYKIFGGVANSADNSDRANGLAVQMTAKMKTAADSIVKQAGTSASFSTDITSTLGKQYKELTTKMTAMSKKLAQQENDYYKRFSAMETALEKLNKQTSNLTSMLGQ